MYRYLVLCVGLVACVPAGDEIASTGTGLAGTYSSRVVISDHPHHVLYGHVVEVGDGARPVRALVISHRRDGVHRLRIDAAWAGGRELPFRRLPRQLGCTHGHCRDDALGMIPLGPLMIDRAADSGFHAVLTGAQGRIAIYVPAMLFQALAASEPQS